MKPRPSKVLLGSLWFIIPLFVGVMLNAVVRPLMAHRLGGEKVVTGAGVRGGDVHWMFDELSRREHPIATTFLGWSHAQIGLITLVVVAVCGLGVWIVGAMTRARQR